MTHPVRICALINYALNRAKNAAVLDLLPFVKFDPASGGYFSDTGMVIVSGNIGSAPFPIQAKKLVYSSESMGTLIHKKLLLLNLIKPGSGSLILAGYQCSLVSIEVVVNDTSM